VLHRQTIQLLLLLLLLLLLVAVLLRGPVLELVTMLCLQLLLNCHRLCLHQCSKVWLLLELMAVEVLLLELVAVAVLLLQQEPALWAVLVRLWHEVAHAQQGWGANWLGQLGHHPGLASG